MIVGQSRKFGVVKTTFAYTGGSQSYVVPTGVISLNFKAWGGAGGGGNGTAGGGGGYVNATNITVTPGETLTVKVGGGGARTSETGKFGGGGGLTGLYRGAALLACAGAGGGGASSRTGGAGGGTTGGSGSSPGVAATGGTQVGGEPAVVPDHPSRAATPQRAPRQMLREVSTVAATAIATIAHGLPVAAAAVTSVADREAIQGLTRAAARAARPIPAAAVQPHRPRAGLRRRRAMPTIPAASPTA